MVVADMQRIIPLPCCINATGVGFPKECANDQIRCGTIAGRDSAFHRTQLPAPAELWFAVHIFAFQKSSGIARRVTGNPNGWQQLICVGGSRLGSI